ncbi:hypothetical protein OQA88_4833 [Cercophora sp. LCS_1]
MADHIIHPLGDTVLTLRQPNAPFAPDSASIQGAKVTVGATDDPSGDVRVAEAAVDSGSNEQAKPVTFLVSSQHLIMVSPMFKAMLTGEWSEAKKVDGVFHIGAEDWDVQALTIFFNIVHSRNRQVPKQISLELFAKIAVIVDYYKAHEAVEIVVDLWLVPLQLSLPTSICRDLTLWVLISWVFGKQSIFRHVTKVAMVRSSNTDPVKMPDGLPIPLSVEAKINERRQEVMETIATRLRDLRDGYISGTAGCSFTCSAVLLGALIKNLVKLKLQEHGSSAISLDSITIVQIAEGLSAVETPLWAFAPPQQRFSWSGGPLHSCPTQSSINYSTAFKLGVGEAIPKEFIRENALVDFAADMIAGLKPRVAGLELSDF